MKDTKFNICIITSVVLLTLFSFGLLHSQHKSLNNAVADLDALHQAYTGD